MSSEFDPARELAERIARRISGSAPGSTAPPKPEVNSQIAAVRAGINDLQKKLAQLEAAVGSEPSERAAAPASIGGDSPRAGLSTHSPWLAGINSSYSHPSQEKFGVEEATVAELVDFFEKEKQCSVEPGGKPCDHCAMCSTRGF